MNQDGRRAGASVGASLLFLTSGGEHGEDAHGIFGKRRFPVECSSPRKAGAACMRNVQSNNDFCGECSPSLLFHPKQTDPRGGTVSELFTDGQR